MSKRGVGALSILSMAANRKRGNRPLFGPAVLVILALMFMAACLPGRVLAASVFDVVKETARVNSHVEEGVDMRSAESPIAGGSMKWSQVHGDLNTSEEWAGAWFEVVEPAGNTSMNQVIDHLVAGLDSDANMKVIAQDGYEIREITYDDYVLGVPNDEVMVWIILAHHVIQIDIHDTGYDKAANLQMGRNMALQLKDGLEKAGLTRPAGPSAAPAGAAPAAGTPPAVTATTGTALDEPVKVSDTMNIAGVYNGATVPTTFSVSSPHLVTYITTYHWNNARGTPGGTIALQGSNGTVYGPWQVTTRPGQGGVPNAYWEVKPNIVVPAGTYTVIDSDPATWSQNSQSGGKGMGEVHATPHFEVTGGRVGDINSDPEKERQSYPVGHGDSPAGVGSVGSIPGPSSTTEAVTGVVVPGLIATALGALGSLGGGGGLIPPVTGTPAFPGGGSGSGPLPGGTPGNGRGPIGMSQATGQIGRRGKDDIFIDTTDMFEEPGGGRTAGEDAIIDTADEAGVFIQPVSDILIDTVHEEPGVIPPDAGIIIDTAEEAGVFGGSASDILVDTIHEEPGVIPPGPGGLTDGSGSEILIDTSALEGKASSGLDTIVAEGESVRGAAPGAEETEGLSEESPLDQEGYNAQGFDKDGFNREGFNKEGFDKEGFDAKGFDKEGFDKEGFDTKGFDKDGFDKEGFDAQGFDKDGFDKEGFDAQGFDKEGFDKEGFDAKGFDKEGFDKDGFDSKGFDKEGFNKDGFDAKGFDKEGFDKEGFDAKGFDKEGFNKDGFDAKGFDKEGFDKAGFDAKGFDKEGFDKAGFDAKGFDKEGFDKAGFDAKGFDKEGFDKDGFDAKGFDKEGFDKAGFDAKGFDKEGFDKAGFDAKGFNKEGFDKAGFDAKGFDKGGFDKAGFDAKGYDREGFNKAGFDQEGYGRNGYDAEGYNRDGLDVNGLDRQGYNRSGYDAEGYNAAGFDRDGFSKAGLDREGFDRAGYNQSGYDREGFDKDGFDRDGYDREGLNKEGRQRDGNDEYGYGKDGFNKEGYDKDGYDLEGFDYKGYNRDGFDPWGYNRQGYDKNGYHWSGYNADGYNRSGRHWSENPYKDSPFDVTVAGNTNPFAQDRDVIASVEVELDADGNVIGGRNLADTWKPTKPPLGEPYPKTAEKFGPKPWTDEVPKPETSQPAAPAAEGTGVIGPEDPMNTLKNHGVGETTEVAPPGSTGTGVPIPEEDIPATGEVPADSGVVGPEEDITASGDVPPESMPDVPPVSGPKNGDTITLPGKDGRDYPLEYNGQTGEWENILTGGKVRDEDLDSYIKDFNKWQDQVADDQKWSAAELEKMGQRQDANSQAIDEALGKWKNLENMQKAADKYGIGEKGGPGDMDKAIQDLKDDMLAGKDIDEDRMEQLKKIIGNRIEGRTTADTGQRWTEEPWYKDFDSAGRATVETAREVVTGEDAEGNTSWLGMGARIAIGAATGGATEGIFTVAEAMHRIKTAVDSGKDGTEAFTGAIKQLVLEEIGGDLAGGAIGKVGKVVADTFPNLTKEAAEMVERNLLKIMKADQMASRGLGLVGAESAEKAIKQMEKRLAELGGDAAGDAAEKAAKAAKKTVAGASDDAAEAAGKAARKGAAGAGDEAAEAAAKKASRGAEDVAGGGKAAKGSADEAVGGGRKAAVDGSEATADGMHAKGKAADQPKNNPAAGDKAVDSAGAGKKAAGAADDAAEASGKRTPGPHVSTETPGLKIDNSSFKDAGQPPDLRGMPARDQKAIQTVSDRYGVKAQMRPTNPEAKKWLETGKAHPKPEMLKTKTINDYDVELGYPKEYSGTVACKKPAPMPAAKPEGMSGEHWQELQKRHKQRLTEYTDQVEKLHHLEQEGKIYWDKNTGVIYNSQTMKPYAGDHDAFAFVDAVTGEPVAPLVNQRINRELQALGATQHPEHAGWDYSGLSDKVPDGAPPGAQSPRQIAEGIDQKILKGHDEGGQPLNTYNPLQGSKGGWSTSYWKGGVRQ